jgi:hypothetical protein
MLALGMAAAQNDPPGRAGRLNFISGAVSFQPGGVDDWVDATINRPLTTGDHLWTDRGARAEVHVGAAALRLNSETVFEFLNLDDKNVQIRLGQGSLTVRLRRLDEDESFEVDTPNLAFSLLRPGEYRIDANPDNQTTTVTVRGGEGEVTGGNQAFSIHARQQARVSGTGSVTYDVADAPPPDAWDRWCLGRDQREERAESVKYVSRDMVGYEDLDEFGTWRVVAGYGPVWAPREVAVGWAPYHFGHWVWVEPWGWTWVDDAPWGFAPFHYGRWAFVTGGWVWVPGPVAVRPVYAPALVAWVGGPHFSVSVSVGRGVAGVAWFPLGPREVFVPAYRTSPAYVSRVNVTNTTITNVNVTNINVTNVRYVNREVPGAVTAVPQTALVTSQPVARTAVAVNSREIANAQVVNAAAVAPRQESVLGRAAGSRASSVRPPAAVMNRPVVAKSTPPPPPVPFARRQAALAANPGHPLDSEAINQIRGREAAPVHPLVKPAMARQGGGGENAAQPPLIERRNTLQRTVEPSQQPPQPRPSIVTPNQPVTANPPPSPRPAPTIVNPAREPKAEREVQPEVGHEPQPAAREPNQPVTANPPPPRPAPSTVNPARERRQKREVQPEVRHEPQPAAREPRREEKREPREPGKGRKSTDEEKEKRRPERP